MQHGTRGGARVALEAALLEERREDDAQLVGRERGADAPAGAAAEGRELVRRVASAEEALGQEALGSCQIRAVLVQERI